MGREKSVLIAGVPSAVAPIGATIYLDVLQRRSAPVIANRLEVFDASMASRLPGIEGDRERPLRGNPSSLLGRRIPVRSGRLGSLNSQIPPEDDMRIWPIIFLVGCSTPGTSHQAVTESTTAAVPNGLTAEAQAQRCPSPAPWQLVDDYRCYVYDADVGASGTCCGGDLRTRECGGGLTCVRPDGKPIGICVDPRYARGGSEVQEWPQDLFPQSVCVDVTTRRDPLGSCGLFTGRDSPDTCSLFAGCGNDEYMMSCEKGSCTCYHYAAAVVTLPASEICSGSESEALAKAQAVCGFPSSYDLTNLQW